MLELKRDIYEKLIEWKKADSGNVLELNGARQVGKTFILDKFARENYKKYFYILSNFKVKNLPINNNLYSFYPMIKKIYIKINKRNAFI